MSAAATYRDKLSQSERLLTVDEVAGLLRVTTRTVRRWVHEGKIEHVRLAGYSIRFTVGQVEALLTNGAPRRNEGLGRDGAPR